MRCETSSDKIKLKFFYLLSLFFLSFWHFNKREFHLLSPLFLEAGRLNISRWRLSRNNYKIYRLVKSLFTLLEGFLALKEEETNEALKFFKKSLSWNKNNSLAYYCTAMTLGKMELYSKAYCFISKAVDSMPDEPSFASAVRLICRYDDSKKVDSKDFSVFTEKNYSEPVAARNLSWLVYGKASPGRTLKYINKAISIFPLSAPLFIYKGFCLERLGQIEDALKAYQQGFEIDSPGFSENLLLGRAFFLYSHYDRAKVFFEKSLSERKECLFSIAYLAEIALKEGNYDEALTYLRKFISLEKNPAIPPLLYLMNVYCFKGNLPEALRVSSEAIIRDGDQIFRPGIRYFRTLIYLESGNLKAAHREINDSLRFDRNNPSALSYKGFILSILGRKTKFFKKRKVQSAIDFCKKALLINPLSAVTYLHLTALYDLSGDRVKKEWALKSLLNLEIDNRHLKIYRLYFPELYEAFKGKLKLPSSPSSKISSLILDEKFLSHFSPFNLFIFSREEELLFFYNAYKLFSSVNFNKNFYLSLFSGTITGKRTDNIYYTKIYEKLLKSNNNRVLREILNDSYLQNKSLTCDAMKNYRAVFFKKPHKVSNTIFLARLLREKGEFDLNALPVYEKCRELRPYDRENLIALVRSYFLNNEEEKCDTETVLQVYEATHKGFPEREAFLLYILKDFLSRKDTGGTALKIYREALEYNISEETKDEIYDLLAGISFKIRRLDEEALIYYLYKYNKGYKEYLFICGHSLFMAGRTDETALHIYREIYFFSPGDGANFLMMVYSMKNMEDKLKESFSSYLPKACEIILSEPDRYFSKFWSPISGELILSLADIYSMNGRRDIFALKVYLPALEFRPEDKKLHYSIFLASLENFYVSPLLFEIYSYYFEKEDTPRERREKIQKILQKLFSTSFKVPYDYRRIVYKVYRKLFLKENWEPGEKDIERLWDYFFISLKRKEMPSIAGGLVSYLSKEEILTLLSNKDIKPFRKGFIYIFMDKPVRGLFYLKESYDEHKKSPVSSVILYCIACINFELGELEEAEKFMALIPPGKDYTAVQLAGLYLKMGKKKEAGELYEKCLDLEDEKDHSVLKDLAGMYLENNEPLIAEKFYKKLKKLSPKDKEADIALGKIALSKELYDEAYNYFISYPNDYRALEGLGQIYYYREKYENVIEIFSTFYKEERKLTPRSYFLFGEALRKEGKFGASIENYSKALETGYDKPHVFLARGIALREGGILKSAAYDFGQFIRLSKIKSNDYLDALINLAELAMEFEDLESALKHWKEAFFLALIPVSLENIQGSEKVDKLKENINIPLHVAEEKLIYISREASFIYTTLKKYKPFELPILNFYLKNNKEDMPVLLYRADLLYKMALKEEDRGRIEIAEKIYRKALSDFDHIPSLLALGKILDNDNEEKFLFLKRAADCGELDTGTYRELFSFYFDKKDYMEAIKYFGILADRDFREEELYLIGELLLSLNLKKEALEIFEKGPEKGMDDKKIHYLLGKSYFEVFPEKKLDKALYHISIAAEEGNYEALSLLGDIYLKADKKDKAREVYEKLSSDEPERFYKLGNLFYEENKLKDSLDFFEIVYEMDNNYKDIVKKLSDLYTCLKSYNPEHLSFIVKSLKRGDLNDWPPEKLLASIGHLYNNYAAYSQWEEASELLDISLEIDRLKAEEKLRAWSVISFIEMDNLKKASLLLGKLPLKKSFSEEEVMKAYRLFSEKLISLGDFSKARKIYEEIYKAAPETPGVGKMLEMLSKERIGRFSLISSVGAGSNAKIWKAFDLTSLRTTALKVLHPEFRDNNILKEELKKEYNLLIELNFPGIVRALPGSFNEYYFAMELLEYSLSDIMDKLSLSRAIEIASQIAEVAGQLHQNNIVYQDLSPDNIMFSGNMLKICDFGGAKKLDSHTKKTIFGGTVAHLAYASPEQCFCIGGGEKPIDITSDIYSLGVLLYEMTAGDLPFNLPDQQLLAAHQYSKAVPPMVKKKDFPKELNDLIMKCMEKEPGKRYQSMKDVWTVLQKIPIRGH